VASRLEGNRHAAWRSFFALKKISPRRWKL
jgi:hypothetical protein